MTDSEISDRLVEIYDALLHAYAPFADPGTDWSEGGEPLEELVKARDLALSQAQPLLDELQELWSRWEAASIPSDERTRVGTARSHLVALGVDVSRSDTRIERMLQRKIDQLRREAHEADQRHRVSRAYNQAQFSGRDSSR
jgi:hypothetical protein